jgi:hypothetical protein
MDWIIKYSEVDNAFGEVIASTHENFTVRAYKPWYENTPEYGSIIVVNCEQLLIIGLVYGSKMETEPGFPTPILLKRMRKDIERDFAGIMDNIMDVYNALSIGFYSNQAIFQRRPPRKPIIHDPAFIPSREFIREFYFSTGSLRVDYLPTLFRSLSSPIPLLEAHFTYISQHLERGEVVEFIKGVIKPFQELDMENEAIIVKRIASKNLLKS